MRTPSVPNCVCCSSEFQPDPSLDGCDHRPVVARRCGHSVCSDCYKKLIHSKKTNCPVCKENEAFGSTSPKINWLACDLLSSLHQGCKTLGLPLRTEPMKLPPTRNMYLQLYRKEANERLENAQKGKHHCRNEMFIQVADHDIRFQVQQGHNWRRWLPPFITVGFLTVALFVDFLHTSSKSNRKSIQS